MLTISLASLFFFVSVCTKIGKKFVMLSGFDISKGLF